MTQIIDILTRAAQEPELNCATLRQFAVLFVTGTGRNPTIGELGNLLKIPSPAVTRTVDVLEVNGFVKRNKTLTNRKLVYLTLTEKGEIVLKRLLYGTTEKKNEK